MEKLPPPSVRLKQRTVWQICTAGNRIALNQIAKLARSCKHRKIHSTILNSLACFHMMLLLFSLEKVLGSFRKRGLELPTYLEMQKAN